MLGRKRMPWGACENLESMSRLSQDAVTPFPVVGKQMNARKKKQQRRLRGPCLDTGDREDGTSGCSSSRERSRALKGKVGGVIQGQRQVHFTPNDSVAIGFKPLANFRH